MNSIDYLGILSSNGWSLICEEVRHDDDSSIMWIVVSYHMRKPYKTVVGECWEEDKPWLAMDDAINTIKYDPHIYKYQYDE